VFLGCSTTDSTGTVERVERSAEILRGLGAAVTLTLYPNMAHAVNADEIASPRGMITRVAIAQ